MKKSLLLSVVILTVMTNALLAQTRDTASLPVKSGNEWQMPKDVLVRSRNFSNDCQRLLGVDSVTTQKLFQLYLGNTKSIDEIRIGAGSEKEKKDALAANQERFDQQVRVLLSAGQFEKYAGLRKAGKIR